MEWKSTAVSWAHALSKAIFVLGLYSTWIIGSTYWKGGTILILEHGEYSDRPDDPAIFAKRKH